MLEDLLNSQEKSHMVLFTDTADSPGRHLLMNWLLCLTRRCDKVVLMSWERPPQFFINWLPPDLRDRVIFIKGNSASSHHDKGGLDIFNLVTSQIAGLDCDFGIVIDSLTPQILLTSPAAVCTALHKLTLDKRMQQVVALLHRDCHDQNICGLLEHIAASVVDVNPPSGSTHNCNVRHCRTTGKVFKTRESYRFDDNLQIHNIGPWKPPDTDSSRAAPHPAPQSDLTADLPFNLTLTETERKARDQVKLPFMKDGSEDSENEAASAGGKIIYQFDDADDFDEEDPDDDLNI